MKRINETDIAILQAKHLYDDAKILAVVRGGGVTIGKDTLTIQVNRMAWGLFEQSILRAMKDRQDLRDRNPELVINEKQCELCAGNGRFDLVPGTKEYDEAYDIFYKYDGQLEDGAAAYGSHLHRFCSPCQGTGLVLKAQE